MELYNNLILPLLVDPIYTPYLMRVLYYYEAYTIQGSSEPFTLSLVYLDHSVLSSFYSTHINREHNIDYFPWSLPPH